MSPEFLRGALVASALVHVAMGLFFGVAFAVRRRDAAYLLFGGVCLSMSAVTALLAQIYGGQPQEMAMTLGLISGASLLALALNLHFVTTFVALGERRRVAVASYGFALAVQLSQAVFPLWIAESTEITQQSLLGASVVQVVVQPGPGVWPYVLYASLTFLFSLWFLFRAYRRGMREAFAPLLGALLIGLALGNDLAITVAPGYGVSLATHAFVFYGLLIAVALLLRYRDTGIELEAAVTRLQQRSDELRESHVELRSAQAELAQKRQLAAVGELAAAIAHEVRNPLAVIVNAAAGLRRTTLSETDRLTLLRIVEEETARLNGLVTDLLHFSRPMTLHRSRVTIGAVGLENRLLPDKRYRVALRSTHDPALEELWVDPDLFRRVLDSLTENACQAMPEGGVIEMGIEHADFHGQRGVRLTISDTGHGMDAEVLSRATAPFFSTRPSGVGLGLSIVQRIVEAHGGTLSLKSEPNRGTRVTLVLPLDEEAERLARDLSSGGLR